MIRLIVCGAAGRMGREIIDLVKHTDGVEVTSGIEAKGHDLIGERIDNIPIVDDIDAVVDKADCIVDFTNHSAALENMGRIKDHKKPFITGTTGFSQEEMVKIGGLSQIMPILLAPNMSVGINHLYNLIESCTATLQDAEIEVIETHHRAKKDAPSGTAKEIARIIKALRPDTEFIYGRKGLLEVRHKKQVCINSVRGGDVVGEHRVLFFGKGEFIELRHYATSRSCFASGAIEAVKYMIGKPPGLYSMRDMLTKK
jgi:4-hydroxy-tetrahydrodipicolinate reductase